MTNKQPAQFDWATELSDAQGHVTLSEQEAHEIGARLRSMGEKLKVYEDLGDAGSDVQLLRMGYAAARLEIESLRGKGWQPIETAPKDGEAVILTEGGKVFHGGFVTIDFREIRDGEGNFIDQIDSDESWMNFDEGDVCTPTHWMPKRSLPMPPDAAIDTASASHGQASAQAAPAYKDSTPELHIGDSAFESWYSTYSPVHKSDKQRARDAYAAGMGDPLVTAAPAGTKMEAIAEVIEELENDGTGWCAKVRWLYNPIPIGERLYWPQPTPQQEAQEPVAWQSRTRPTWESNTRQWSPWEPCTKEQAEDFWKTPLLHDWAYEARALYTAPPPSPAPLSDDLRDRLVAISEAIAYQDDRAAQAMLREILKAPQPSPAAQGDASDPLQGAANWLVSAHTDLAVSTLAGKLSIGYNRAKRLIDAARAAYEER